ncbi:MAG: prolyl oligopeptidase family serine peptidase [Asticcacaulis sp.]
MQNISRRAVFEGLTAFIACITAPDAFASNGDDAPPDLAIFGKLPDIESVSLSPDGNHVGLIKRINDKTVVVDYDREQQDFRFRQVSGAKVRSLSWADNEHLLVVVTQFEEIERFAGGKNEYSQGLVMSLWKGTYRVLYEGMHGFAPIISGNCHVIDYKGERCITASNHRFVSSTFRTLYAFSLTSDRKYPLDETPDHAEYWILSKDGDILAREDFDLSSRNWTLRLAPTPKALLKKVHSQTFPGVARANLIGLGRTEGTFLVSMPDENGDFRYHEITASGDLSAPLHDDTSETATIYHPKTKLLAGFQTGQYDRRTYVYFDPLMEKIPSLVKKAMGDNYYAITYSMADDPRKVIAYTEGEANAGSFYFIDFGSGESEIMGSQYPDMPEEWVANKSKFTYKASDGLEIEAYLTLPPFREVKNLPLLVMPHGGPVAYDSMNYDWMAQAVASRGYAVLQPNFRGSSGYGLDFIKAGYGEWGRKMQTDLSDGVRHLAESGIIAPERVAIAGASYGGYAALAGAAFDADVYRCAISIAGLSDIHRWMEWELEEVARNKKASSIQIWKQRLGDEKRWPHISPARHADAIKAPILLIHGKDDDVVPFEQSTIMRNALRRANKPFEFAELKREDHWLTFEVTRIQTLELMISFLQKHNPA